MKEEGLVIYESGVTLALPWPPPPASRATLSMDGAFSTTDGTAAAGMVLRRHCESVIFAAYLCT